MIEDVLLGVILDLHRMHALTHKMHTIIHLLPGGAVTQGQYRQEVEVIAQGVAAGASAGAGAVVLTILGN